MVWRKCRMLCRFGDIFVFLQGVWAHSENGNKTSRRCRPVEGLRGSECGVEDGQLGV